MRVRKAAVVRDVPAELLRFARAVEEVDLVAAPGHRELRSLDTPRGREVALHLNGQSLRDGFERTGARPTSLCVVDQRHGPHFAPGMGLRFFFPPGKKN